MRLRCTQFTRLIAGLAVSAALLGFVQRTDARPAQKDPKQAPYPASGDILATTRWLRAYTNLSLENIVILTEGFAVSSEERSSQEAPLGRVVDLEVREEALTEQFAKTMRARSARLDVSVRCQDRRLKTNRLAFFAGPNLTGRSEPAQPSPSWVNAPTGAFAGDLVSAVCDSDYQPPLFGKPAEPSKPSPTPPTAHNIQIEAAGSAGALAPTNAIRAHRPLGPTASAPSPSAYGIELGAYSALSHANQLIDRVQALRLTPDGVKYYITIGHKDAALIYLVQLKNFSTRKAADQFCRELRDIKLECRLQ